MAAVYILGGAMSLTYGLLDILSPSTTIRWQVRRLLGVGVDGVLEDLPLPACHGIDARPRH